MTPERLLIETMLEQGYNYASFHAFIENESSVNVFDVFCIAVEKAIKNGKEKKK